ncbi:hypothetical protein AGMMS50276_20860 [Synergistales bacterium]|nr:hypothetical protein AGMMS50276_20860 [Synergistales bacterium]
MKTFFVAAMAIIIVLSGLFVGYGIYLNQASSSYIAMMMEGRSINVRGARVSLREIRPEITINNVTLKTDRTADVIARVDGTVGEFAVAQAQAVKRGDVLCRLVNTDIALQISRSETDIAKAEASYAQAKSEADRNQRLSAKDSISKSEVETSVARVKASEAELSAAKIARSQLVQERAFQTVTSPIDGFVILIYSQTGSYIQKGTPVALIADFSKLMFIEQLPDEKIKNMSPLGDSFSIHMDTSYLSEKALDVAFRSGFDEEFAIAARILDITPPMSESAPLRIVTWELDNDLGLLEPGHYNSFTVSREDFKKTLAVPMALIGDMKSPSLYVEDSQGRLAVKNIVRGVYGGGFVEIKDGINEGDLVVTSDVNDLELGTKIDVILEEF